MKGLWQQVAVMPGVLWPQGCRLPDGRVVIAGGRTEDGVERSVHVFNPKSGRLSNGPAMRSRRFGFALVATPGGSVVALGGTARREIRVRDGRKVFEGDTVAEMWNGIDEEWKPILTLELPALNDFVATPIDKAQLLLTGGRRSDESPSRQSWLIDLESLSVKGTSRMICGHVHHDAVFLPGTNRVLLVGAESDVAEVYDIDADIWQAAGCVPQRREGMRLVLASDDQVLCVGGIAPNPLNFVRRWGDSNWTLDEPLPVPVGSVPASRMISGHSVVVGAGDDGDRVLLYNLDAEAWQVLAGPQEARFGHMALPIGEAELLVAGGLDCSSIEVLSLLS